MKKRILWIAGICILSLVLSVGITRYNTIPKRESDLDWQIAKEIYRVENALKEVDEDYECQSVAKVTPFTYTDSEGNTIVYYCIQNAYLENESGDYTRLDMNAIGLVIDADLIENRRECILYRDGGYVWHCLHMPHGNPVISFKSHSLYGTHLLGSSSLDYDDLFLRKVFWLIWRMHNFSLVGLGWNSLSQLFCP